MASDQNADIQLKLPSRPWRNSSQLRPGRRAAEDGKHNQPPSSICNTVNYRYCVQEACLALFFGGAPLRLAPSPIALAWADLTAE